jgi:hypothetical protein
MKANEAPEKVYIHKSQYWGLMANEHNITKNGVEYIRTDAFIEKAADYIKRHSALLDSDGNDCMPKWIEEFKKAMRL